MTLRLLEVDVPAYSNQRQMRDIACRVEPVRATEAGSHVLSIFQDNAELAGIPVVDECNRPIGIVQRRDFFLRLGQRFGYEVYANRPISLLMECEPIQVDVHEKVSDFVATILNIRSLNQINEFIITECGQYYGLGSALSLTRSLHAQAMDTINELNKIAGELRQANKTIMRDKSFISGIVDNIPTAIQVRDIKTGDIIVHNKAAEEYGLQTAASYAGMLLDAPLQLDGELAEDPFLYQQPEAVEETLVDREGRARVVSRHDLLIADDDGNMRWKLCVADDITEYRDAQRRIERLAHYDSLTGLPNRYYLGIRLGELSQDLSNPFVLLYIDLDYFKSINDMYGHSGGDELLIAAANRLKACCREEDFVARLGGDEFAVIWQHCGPLDEIESRLEELVASLGRPYIIQGAEAKSGASIGAAGFPLQAGDVTTLLQYADMALYRAKALGRCQHKLFDTDLSYEILERAELVAALHRLVEGDGLLLHYQPIYGIHARKVQSYEALARWNHPERGMIPPDVFIRLAEETGLIHQLGERILHLACSEALNWPEHINVSVNVSPLQLKNRKFPEIVKNVLEKTGLNGARLEVEITESVLMDEYEHKNVILNELKALGCKISMDDFGTGYSSLSYLWKFSFDKIKIDRSFIQALPDPTAKEIIQAILGIASIRAMTVTVEGVETAAQLQMVSNMGCSEAQGYYLGRPQQQAIAGTRDTETALVWE
ncbi:EAL domain-containing protein [Acetobacter sp. DsW_54]|uniref:EAL domain-containing protein n=1 Tax=Acetobacter sp. DsW_54 TaxID=1670660 RepID=UPI000A37D035|nr:EAL domain-containing protein [Acetobacter sp. DsW_54]